MHGVGPAKSAEFSSARLAGGLLAVLVLGGCAHPPQPVRVAVAAVTDGHGPCYRLDAAQSELRVLVYRAGALARLGHNHVLVAAGLAGELCGERFVLTVPVASLEVDPSAARAAEGAEFATEPSADDIAATRRHLLGSGQLEADAWPLIQVTGVVVRHGAEGVVAVRLEVRGGFAELQVPVQFSGEREGRLVTSGGLELAQSSLGLVPYSVALGALRVRDEVSIRFRLVAERVVDPPAGAQRKPTDPVS